MDEYNDIYKIMGMSTVYHLNNKVRDGKTKEFDKADIEMVDADVNVEIDVPVINNYAEEDSSNIDIRQLEDFFNSLTTQDKEFVCSYWLGKCYEKKEGFYDRYKVELLNRLSNSHVFDNLLTLMNGDFRADNN